MGRIVAPFGINGWLKIQPLGDDPLSWRKMPQWWLGKNPESQQAEDWQPYTPRTVREHGKLVVAALTGLDNRTAAEALDGFFIAAPREALPPPAKDEYYWSDLQGLSVVNAAGIALGTVRRLLDTGAHSVLEVTEGETERLIPFVAVYVQEVDLAAGLIRVDWEADW